MPASAKGQLKLSMALSQPSFAVLVLNNLKTETLIPISQICDDCIAIFRIYHVNLFKDKQLIIIVKRENNACGLSP